MKTLLNHSKPKFILAVAIQSVGGILYLLLLHFAVVEEATEKVKMTFKESLLAPLFVLGVIVLLQAFYIFLTYTYELFLENSEKNLTSSKEKVFFSFQLLTFLVSMLGNLLFFRNSWIFQLQCIGLVVTLPILFYLHLSLQRLLLKKKETVWHILQHWGVAGSFLLLLNKEFVWWSVVVASISLLLGNLFLLYDLYFAQHPKIEREKKYDTG